jgi:hypothetical protein
MSLPSAFSTREAQWHIAADRLISLTMSLLKTIQASPRSLYETTVIYSVKPDDHAAGSRAEP